MYELSGEEILGVDEYLMGATAKPKVINRKPTTSRVLALGFDSVTVVTKATSRKITTRAQQVFRPDRLTVAAAIAGFFTLDDLRIGSKSQFLSGDSLPAEAFSNVAVGVTMQMDTVTPGIDVMIAVTNIDAAADHRFNGAMFGPTVS